jgi:hypothetical protein
LYSPHLCCVIYTQNVEQVLEVLICWSVWSLTTPISC